MSFDNGIWFVMGTAVWPGGEAVYVWWYDINGVLLRVVSKCSLSLPFSTLQICEVLCIFGH